MPSGRMAVVVKGDAVNATGGPGNVMYYSTTTMAKNAGPAQNPPDVENLGDQTINGIHATGTRVTTTIPAGSMGNEQAILVQSETWSSPELKATVMTKLSNFAPCRSYLRSDALPPHSGDLSWLRLGQNLFCC